MKRRRRLLEVTSSAERVVAHAKRLASSGEDVEAVFQSEEYRSLSQQQKLDILSYLSIADQEERRWGSPICSCGQPLPQTKGLSRAFEDALLPIMRTHGGSACSPCSHTAVALSRRLRQLCQALAFFVCASPPSRAALSSWDDLVAVAKVCLARGQLSASSSLCLLYREPLTHFLAPTHPPCP